MLSDPLVSLQGSRRQRPGLWGTRTCPEISTSTKPLPAERSSFSGPPRLPPKPTCWHSRASFTGIWLGSPAATQLPAQLLDLRAGVCTRPSRWLHLLQRQHPFWKGNSFAPACRRQERRVTGSQTEIPGGALRPHRFRSSPNP